MTKIEFYSLYGYSDSNIVKVKREGYTDGKYQYYKLGSVWFAIVPGYGASIAEGKTRKEAQAKAHEKTEALKKILETNGEKLRERFLDAPTQEEIEHNARVAEEQHTETETEEEITEEITEPATEKEEEKENEPMTTTYNITYNAQYDSHEVTFESKPATAVLDALKALKMRWNPKKACWYGFAKEHEIINAIIESGEGETITGEKTEGATVYTDGYLGGGAVYGSKSNLHLYGADLSKAIREDIKRAGIKGVTVRCKRYTGGQSVGVTVSLRPDEFVSLAEYIEKFEPGTCGDYGYIRTESGVHRITNREFYEASAEDQQKMRRAAAEYEYEQLTAKECSLSIYYLDDCRHLTPDAHAKIKNINEIICAYRYDESNGMVDYFDTNFYYDIYTKPAAVKPTTPDDEPTKPTKDEPKEEPAAEETAPVQPAEQAQESAKAPRYQVIVNDDRYGGLDEKLDYSRITDARKAMHDYVNKEDWESAAIYDRKSSEIIETYGEYFPVDQINVRAKAQEAESVVESVVESAEAPEVVYVVDNNGHDIVTRHLDGINYKVTFREDGKPLGNPETFTVDSIMFVYGIDVTAPPVEPTETASEPQQPENALDIAYTANLRRVYENTLSRMANNEYYGSETENGIKMALEYLEPMPEILTEDQINHAMRLAMCRRNSHDKPTPVPTPAETVPESAGDTPEEVPEPVKPSPIREDLACRAHDMMSYSDYREGSATAEYNTLCERAEALAGIGGDITRQAKCPRSDKYP